MSPMNVIMCLQSVDDIIACVLSRMREETLKNLVHVVDKLDEKHLQDKLVRCISSLQGDAEASIRTNVTIFLGKIAPKLKEATRNKILCSSFLKAMRDNFMHCRVAGLRAAVACLSLIEPAQLSKSLMPQLCILLLDRHVDVRELALQLLESCLPLMKTEMRRLTELEQAAKARGEHSNADGDGRGAGQSSTSGGGGSGGNDSATSSFLSWAVDGLAKAAITASVGADAAKPAGSNSAEIPKPITSASSSSSSSSSASSSYGQLATSSPARSSYAPSSSLSSSAKAPPAPKSVALPMSSADDFDDWDDNAGNEVDIDIPDEDLVMDDDNNNNTSSSKLGGGAAGGGWDDDFDVPDDDEEDTKTKPSKPTPAVSTNSSSSSFGKSGTLGMKLPTAAPASAPASKSAWDDDDDMFDAVETKVVEPKQVKPTAAGTGSSKASTSASTPPIPTATTPTTMSPSSSINNLSSKAKSSTAASSGLGSAAKPKKAVTKLAVEKDDGNWDDF
jgi:hypothetical protein